MALEHHHIHILKLAKKGADPEGWAQVSAPIYKHIKGNIPPDLLEMEDMPEGRGRAKLTLRGHAIVDHF